MTDTGSRAFRAVVHVGSQVTPYVCCGRGAPLLLIAADDAVRERLVALLCGAYRVVAVAPPAIARQGVPLDVATAWLRGVIDGIGLESPRVLLSSSLAAYAPAAAAAGEGMALILDASRPDAALLAALQPISG